MPNATTAAAIGRRRGRWPVFDPAAAIENAESVSPCKVCAASTCCLLSFLIGIANLAAGATASAEAADDVDPSSDFRSLGAACNIVDVRHCWSTRETISKGGVQAVCTDEYVYVFELPSNAEFSDTYQSRKELVPRSRSGCGSGCRHDDLRLDNSSSGGPAHGAFATNTSQPCWAPVSRQRHELSVRYNCGEGASPAGDACLKLFDPIDELEAMGGAGFSELFFGCFLLIVAVGLSAFVVPCLLAKWQKHARGGAAEGKRTARV